MTPADSAFFLLLGDRLRRLRKKRGFEREDIAERIREREKLPERSGKKVGGSERTIASIEAGKPCGLRALLQIARALDVDVTWLLRGLQKRSVAVSPVDVAELEARHKIPRGRPRKKRKK